jgi:hypothetical protein
LGIFACLMIAFLDLWFDVMCRVTFRLLFFYTPLDQTIYANPEGVLWKWAGSRFEQARAEEQRKS